MKGETNQMKSTGMVRPIDELGRTVLPKNLRTDLDINPKDSVEIFTEGDRIILQKYLPACIFCGNTDRIVFFTGKRICTECLEKLKSMR
jgi:transcriptional pleiotropic regulator of transition state genes